METLKNEIKNAAAMQIVLKDQRKTVRNKLERTIDPSVATWKHYSNREQLRIMYAAQGILRGKTFNQIENTFPDENHPLNAFKTSIDKLVELHKDEKIVHLSE